MPRVKHELFSPSRRTLERCSAKLPFIISKRRAFCEFVELQLRVTRRTTASRISRVKANSLVNSRAIFLTFFSSINKHKKVLVLQCSAKSEKFNDKFEDKLVVHFSAFY